MYKRILNYKIKMPGTKQGFTLAEVLITLTVIGVIAALTIPSLITNIQDSQNRTAWKNIASDLSQAARKLATDNGGSLSGVFSSSDNVRDKLSAYFSFVKNCNVGVATGPDGCWNANIYNLSGNDFIYWSPLSNYSRSVVNNGMFFMYFLASGNCTNNRSVKHNACAMLGIDVNGFKGPNAVGKDIYWGYITEDGNFEPFGKQGDYWDTYGSGGRAGCDTNVHSDAIGFTCAAQYLHQ